MSTRVYKIITKRNRAYVIADSKEKALKLAKDTTIDQVKFHSSIPIEEVPALKELYDEKGEHIYKSNIMPF